MKNRRRRLVKLGARRALFGRPPIRIGMPSRKVFELQVRDICDGNGHGGRRSGVRVRFSKQRRQRIAIESLHRPPTGQAEQIAPQPAAQIGHCGAGRKAVGLIGRHGLVGRLFQ
jgi:hypothetical protein